MITTRSASSASTWPAVVSAEAQFTLTDLCGLTPSRQ